MQGNAEFQELADSYFRSCYRFSPTSATDLGLHEYDHLLDDLSQRAIRARIAELRRFRTAFRRLEIRDGEIELETDLALILSDIANELFLLEDTRDWETDPSYYIADPFFSIFLLASRDFAPQAARVESLTARLEHVPELLAAARANLKEPPRILTQIGIEETEGAIEFCSTLIPQLARQGKPSPRLLQAASRASRSLYEFLDYLRGSLLPVSTGKIGIGSKNYLKILKHEHMLPYTIEQVVAVGQRVFEETERELAEWARHIEPGKTWREIADEARTQYPHRERLLGAYRKEVTQLRRFVEEQALVTLPEKDCQVVATPPFERALNSFAAYIAPGPFDEDQRGQFWVTPVDTSAPIAEQVEQLEEHCNYLFPITAAHEAYPGHHVQLVRANQVGSRWRKHFSSSLFAEGWALYCEELMNEAGYYRDPRMRLFQLKGRLLRAARVINEIGIHCYDLSLKDAELMLVEKVGLTKAAARAETRRYVAEPGQPMSYLLGELEVLRLRDKFMQLTRRQFHDLLLDSGTIPFALVEKEMELKVNGAPHPAAASPRTDRRRKG